MKKLLFIIASILSLPAIAAGFHYAFRFFSEPYRENPSWSLTGAMTALTWGCLWFILIRICFPHRFIKPRY